jgi:hypothetical protein
VQGFSENPWQKPAEGFCCIDDQRQGRIMTKIRIENILQPGKTYPVDAAKFAAMRSAYLACVPPDGPGATPAQIQKALIPALPQDLFPGGAKAGWWAKAVQLDLEAKGTIRRAPGAPVRLTRA